MTAPLLPRFHMLFEPMTIEHLGLRLYSTLPPVIGEIVSNAYDAEAPKVEIVIPSGVLTQASEVVIRDFGHGMKADEIQSEYLPIGRNRRGRNSDRVMSKNKRVRVTGRKGLGKLSVFGVANQMDLRSIVDGNAVALRFDYPTMLSWPDAHGTAPYEPLVLTELTGKTDEANGTEIRLRHFHRKTPFSPEMVRRGLAKRQKFIGQSFQVVVNGVPVGPGDRLNRSDAAISWDLSTTPVGTTLRASATVSGWIGFLADASQSDRGVDIFANKKAVELGSFFNFASTHAQFARAHVVGEVHADFLDDKTDLAATARNSVVWESPEGELLETWGQNLLKWAFEQWLASRMKQKEEAIITTGNFDQWLQTRSTREQRIAKRLVATLVEDENLEASSTGPLLEIVKSSVEHLAFQELVDSLDERGSGVATLLELFDEWRVIEAREHLKLSDGRRTALDELNIYIENGALEVQQMQPLFEKNPWLLDSAWTEVNGQSTYSKLLRENCKEPKDLEDKDRRMDILGIATSGILTIVELKRPEKTLSRLDLDQIERYVDWARANLRGTGPASPKLIHGLLIVGHMSSSAEVQEKARRLGGDGIRVETFSDVYERGMQYHAEVDRVLRKVAPEYKPKRPAKGNSAVVQK